MTIAAPPTFKVVPRPGTPFARLLVDCDRHGTGYCKVSLGPTAMHDQVWQWDGNVEKPTISPSINCHGGCKRHYTIVNGVPLMTPYD